MNINSIYIIMIPLILVLKGIYYLTISTFKQKFFVNKISIVKVDDKNFKKKCFFISKAYFSIGSIVFLFLSIVNICYPSNNLQRVFFILLITLISNIFIEKLSIIKCQIYDYDKSKKECFYD